MVATERRKCGGNVQGQCRAACVRVSEHVRVCVCALVCMCEVCLLPLSAVYLLLIHFEESLSTFVLKTEKAASVCASMCVGVLISTTAK